MSHPDETYVAWPQIFTMHWEGPAQAVAPDGAAGSDRPDPEEDPGRTTRRLRADELWDEIRREAHRRGDPALWDRKLAAYRFVKLEARGNAADHAQAERMNHATVRGWIHEVGRLAYRVGYRLHEDRLLLVGESHPDLAPLRRLVNEDAGSEAAWRELLRVAPSFRGEDPYFHLNEGHVLRSRAALRASEDTLKEGLAIAEARPVRALLWNARGQTVWDCTPGSSDPRPDHLERAERAFRRAVTLDQSAYFPFVNLTELAVDRGDQRRAEYWIGELAAARKSMDEPMRLDLARYLDQAPWADAVESMRFWQSGPLRWIHDGLRKGALALAAALLIASASAAPTHAVSHREPTVVARTATRPQMPPDTPSNGGKERARGGAGGN